MVGIEIVPEPQSDVASTSSACDFQSKTLPEDKACASKDSQVNLQMIDPQVDIGEMLAKGKEKLQHTDLVRAIKNRYVPKKDRLPYSMHKKGGKMEKKFLGRHYYDTFPWLTSSEMDGFEGAWCIWCAIFKSSSSCGGHWDMGLQSVGTLVKKPLKSFAKLTGKDGALTSHANTNYHKSVASKVTEFLARNQTDGKNDIASIIDRNREEIRQENRSALRITADTLLTCARQNIALRGHRDSGRLSLDEPDENDGNLRALLRMRIRAGDQTLLNHVKHGQGNAQYISPEIQNQLIECTSDLIKRKVLQRVYKAGIWSVIADETTDRKKREQLTIALRYVEIIEEDDKIKANVVESPICVIDVLQEMAEKVGIDPSDGHSELAMSGRNIGTVILAKLKELNLDLSKLVGQGYDGASSMASQQVGVAAIVKDEAPLAEYFHCAMHMLNLCATRSTRVVSIRNCLDTIQQMTSFFNSSAKRVIHLEAEIANAGIDENKQRRLKTLCQTRFLERHEAVINTLSLLPSFGW
ncbi:zinc finger MYM-type protein 1-like [Lytechinus variegatus]|uniref:zinc finger MYM-type protein 1-like n=1 Tax=Lytechinus variegatus TaxID=7654 RepID=UPI001BB20F7A|nr:zinc finger MYM-type protein 1-like [Lytechinus variegatus]